MNRRALIEKLADDNYNHYRDLARSNDELKILYSRTNMFRDVSDRDKIYAEYVNNLEAGARDRYEFSLSGCLAVDSLLYEYSEKAKTAGVSFSAETRSCAFVAQNSDRRHRVIHVFFIF